MIRLSIVIALLLMSITSNTQDWVDQNGIMHNCTVLRSIIEAYGDEPLTKIDGLERTVAELFSNLFPSCPTESEMPAQQAPAPTTNSKSTPAENLYSFNSDEEGLQPVLGPLMLPAGVYVFTATTDGYMSVSPQSLSGDCGTDLRLSIFTLTRGDGSDGAQSVVEVEKDCEVLFEIGNTSERWMLNIRSSDGLPVQSFSASYSTNSDAEGLQPVLGPILLRAGIYIFTATTDGYMSVSPQSLSGDCGTDLRLSIFTLSRGDGSDGAQSVVEVEKDCEVLFEIGNTSERWMLEFTKLS